MNTVLLVGSPNVGKSMLFNRLTGQYGTVSNYPGTTVDIHSGKMKLGRNQLQIIDTPGIYGLKPRSGEEQITHRLLVEAAPKWVVHVVDAKNLPRMLPLTLELLNAGFPVILVVNMLDEAHFAGLNIDLDVLSNRLQIPVIGTVASRGSGIDELKRVLEKKPPFLSAKGGIRPGRHLYSRMEQLHNEAIKICADCVTEKTPTAIWSNLDAFLLHPLTGLATALFVLYFFIYQLVGVGTAGYIVDYLDKVVFRQHLNPPLTILFSHVEPFWFRELFMGEYGLISLGLRYSLAIILPIVGVFFFIFALLEDSGYLPRLSLLMDKALRYVGISGRGIIPLVLGLGCGTMATVVTRTLETERERRITTFLLALAVPCSAQLGIFIAMLARYPEALIIWIATVILVFIWAGTLLNLLTPTLEHSFVIELPPMRIPNLSNCFRKSWTRLVWYLKEVIPLFMLASLLIWLGKLTGLFDILISSLGVALTSLRLSKDLAPIVLLGFFRRDYGAAGLYALEDQLGWGQLSVISVVLTLFVPCVAQFAVMIKERGLFWALLITGSVMFIAFSVGYLLSIVIGL